MLFLRLDLKSLYSISKVLRNDKKKKNAEKNVVEGITLQIYQPSFSTPWIAVSALLGLITMADTQAQVPINKTS